MADKLSPTEVTKAKEARTHIDRALTRPGDTAAIVAVARAYLALNAILAPRTKTKAKATCTAAEMFAARAAMAAASRAKSEGGRQ